MSRNVANEGTWGWLRGALALAALPLALTACADEPVPDAPSGADAAAESSLTTSEWAVGPASGDFSECVAALDITDFSQNLPPDLEIVGGRLQLRQGAQALPNMWIANSWDSWPTMTDWRSNSVSRINLTTGARVATHPVGERAALIGGRTIQQVGYSPSRTAVDLDYNVYVGQRWGGNDGWFSSVTKIDGNTTCTGDNCTGQTLWQRQLEGVVRGVAVDAENRPWIGLWGSGELVRLNPTTGLVAARYAVGRRIYGMAIDGAGLIWYAVLADLSHDGVGGVGCFDTNTNTGCGFYQMRRPNNTFAGQIYGIAVDQQGNVWTGMWSDGGIGRIDRASFNAARAAGLPLNSNTVTTQHITFPGQLAYTRGIAVDGNGIIWVASSTENRLYRYNPASGTITGSAGTCGAPIGVGISEQGHAWTMCFNSNQAQAFRLDTLAGVYTTAVGVSPYSYSDFTGFALRNITAPSGVYSRIFDCGVEGCGFDWLDWDAIVPPGSGLQLRWRGSVNGTDWSAWSPFYDTPPEFVLPGGVTPRYIELEIAFEASPTGQSPSLGGVTFWRCPQDRPPSDLTIDNRWITTNVTNHGISWAFTDQSWPEELFQGLDMAGGTPGSVRCTLASETRDRMGDRYSGNPPRPACVENNLQSNMLIARAFRSARRNSTGAWVYSNVGPTVQGYTLVNNPTAANNDLRLTALGGATVQVQWCRPINNAMAGLTGARLERSTNPTFSAGTTTVLTNFDFASRGYPAGGTACGAVTDTNGGAGFVPGATYYYRLTYRNGDGILSTPLILSVTTFGGPCCFNGICQGVCLDGELTALGCEAPPTFQPNETLCDGLDNDCDGLIDEGLLNACGTCGPTPVEVCDGIDNDCNGIIDDNPVNGTRYYRDADGDGFGDPNNSILACSQPPGYVTNNTDCNDSNPNIRPGAFDVCNGIDDNCNGLIDEDDPPSTWYRDADGDGFGNNAVTQVACTAPAGFVATGGDCDDTRNFVYPGAPELCDGLDNNCNGQIDEGFMQATVEVTQVRKLTDPGVGLAACDNNYTGPVCEGALATTVRIRNTGSVAIPTSATLSFFLNGTAAANRIGGPFNVLSQIPVGGDVTRTYCYGPAYSGPPASITARLTAQAPIACGPRDGVLNNVDLGDGVEVCDGIDNDCDSLVDERPEACGAVMDCIRNPSTGEYRCQAT